MSKNFCSLRMSKYKTFPQLNGLQQHNDREILCPNVDANKSGENVSLIPNSGRYTERWHDIVALEEVSRGEKIKRRKDSVIALEFVTSFSRGALSESEIPKWAEANVEWMKKTFGENHIISSTLHMDESTPHIHTEIIPIDERGHLCAKSFTGGRKAMANLQSSYVQAMEEFGLERGERNSKAKKKTLKKFYNSINDADKAKLPPQRDNESNDDYLLRMEEYCRKMKMAKKKLEMELEEANKLIGTRIAQEFSQYSMAVSLFEDLFEKYGGDVEKINKRLENYRLLENRLPDDTAEGLIKSLLTRFEEYATPLTNWAKKGKYALSGVSQQLPNSSDDKTKENLQAIDADDREIGDEYEDGYFESSDDNSNGDLDI